MKKIITSILFLLVTLPMLAQEKTLEKVDNNLYEYKVFNEEGDLQQKGFYKKKNDEFVHHGIWKDSFGTKALYENGKMVWIKPKNDRKYTYQEIKIRILRNKVMKLEERLTSL